MSIEHELQALREENARLNKINQALIERVEAGKRLPSSPYAAFEQAAALAEQVKARTAQLTELNKQLTQEIKERTRIEASLLEAKQEAEQANLSKTKFLAAVSHDLLQPLNAARLFTGALEEQPLTEPLQQLVSSISYSLMGVESLISTLVDISKLDAGVIQPDLSVFALNDLLDNLATEYLQVARSENLRFRYVPCRLDVQTDFNLLARILRNLLTNAVSYTAKGGRVLLGARRLKNSVVVQVLDTGPGIPAHHLEKIFQEFQRLDQATQPHRDQGLGLGLAIVDRMAKMLGLTVRVRSCPQRGSAFSVEIPLASDKAPGPVALPSLEASAWPLESPCAWILDNDLAICEGMESLLNSWGCATKAAQDSEGLDALVAASTALPDVLIVDYHLGQDRSGLRLAEDLQKRLRASLPVLVITANHTHTLKAEIKKQGYLLLYKPIQPLSLRQALTHLMKSARST